MQTVSTVKDLQALLNPLKEKNKSIGLVPTMGALHKGHLSLIQEAKKHCDIVVVSIFVNPTQFAPHEDLDQYPRPIEKDKLLLNDANVDILFTPTDSDIYPNGKINTTQIELPHLSTQLCGKTRPHFFKGVLMVVNRLFGIVQPTHAFFGEKDFQQLTVITHMVSDLHMPIQVIGCPIIREQDGLAMSSRNIYLSPQQRQNAQAIHHSMQTAKAQFAKGETSAQSLIATMSKILTDANFKIDYIQIIDPKTLADVDQVQPGTRIAIAAYQGTTRLIDNTSLL